MDSGQSTKRSSQTEEQLSRLSIAVDRALSLRADIEVRILPVLLSQPPIPVKEKVVQALVPLAESLLDLNEKVNMLNDGMENILNRIEL